jgi:hypothetical protein
MMGVSTTTSLLSSTGQKMDCRNQRRLRSGAGITVLVVSYQ